MKSLTAFLICAMFAVAACGSDSSNDSSSTQSQTNAGTTESTTTTPSKSNGSSDSKKQSKTKSPSSKSSSGLSTAAAQKKAAQSRKQAQENLRKAKQRLLKQEQNSSSKPTTTIKPGKDVSVYPVKQRAVYAGAAAACQIRGVKGIAEAYKINSTNKYTVAKGYAKKIAPGAAYDAAYTGCINGFKKKPPKNAIP